MHVKLHVPDSMSPTLADADRVRKYKFVSILDTASFTEFKSAGEQPPLSGPGGMLV
jgi:hypothetical protein